MAPRTTFGIASRRPRATAIATACALVGSCAPGVSTIRLGRPVALESGEPANPCERADWIEMVPTRASTSQGDQTGGGRGWVEITTVSERVPGYAMWTIGSERPRDLRRVLPLMRESQLEADHLIRIAPILRRQERAHTLAITSMVMLGAGLTVLAIGSASYGSAMYDIGLWGGLTLTVAALVPAFWFRSVNPSADERAYALPRTYVVVPGEDDLAAAQRGATTINLGTRARCGGAPR